MDDEYELTIVGGRHSHTLRSQQYGARDHARPTGRLSWYLGASDIYKLMAEYEYGLSPPMGIWTGWSVVPGLSSYKVHNGRTGETDGPFDTLEEAQNYAAVRYRLNPREGVK